MIIISLGCEKQAPAQPPVPQIPLRFGDCASASVAWISGPRPMAFTLAQAEGGWADPVVAAPTVAPDPPPPRPKPPAAAGKPSPRIALLEDKNRKVLENIVDSSDLNANLGKFAGIQGVGVTLGKQPNGGTGHGVGGAGHVGGIRKPDDDAVAMADLLTGDPPPVPTLAAGGYWFGAGWPPHSAGGDLGSLLADRRGVFRPSTAGLQSPARYTSGAANPFAAQAAALSDCLQRGSARYGAFLVELAFDPAGAVTSATTTGLSDEAAKTCIGELAKTIKRPWNVGPSARCSIAFGAMPLDVAAHAVALDVTTLGFEGKPTDYGLLRSAIEARVSAAAHGAAGTLQLFGPIVLEPADATPMKSIYQATHTILEAGDDFVFARRAAAWQLLVPLELPVVPVPVGTGARWNRFEASPPPNAKPDPARTRVTLTVDSKQITLAVGATPTVFPRDATLHDKLGAALRALKASNEFSGRTDLGLAGADDATYADLLTLVDLATGAGFVDWQLTAPPAS